MIHCCPLFQSGKHVQLVSVPCAIYSRWSSIDLHISVCRYLRLEGAAHDSHGRRMRPGDCRSMASRVSTVEHLCLYMSNTCLDTRHLQAISCMGRLLLLLSLLLQDLLTVLTTVTPSLPTFLTVLCAVPNGFTGGLVITCASVYSHAARNSAESVKTVRFAVIITALTLGFQLGMFIGGQIFAFSHGKHFSVFIISATFLASCLVYLWAVLPLGDEIRNATRQELIRVKLDMPFHDY